jgi:hypothetical protein
MQPAEPGYSILSSCSFNVKFPDVDLHLRQVAYDTKRNIVDEIYIFYMYMLYLTYYIKEVSHDIV